MGGCAGVDFLPPSTAGEVAAMLSFLLAGNGTATPTWPADSAREALLVAMAVRAAVSGEAASA